jgi:hypothetical protein
MSMSLLDLAGALRVLGALSVESRPEASAEAAAATVRCYLEHSAPRVVWKRFGGALRRLPTGEASAVIEDALQNVLLAAMKPGAAFRGTSSKAGVSWCRAVLVTQVANELRARMASSKASRASLTGACEDVTDSDAPEEDPPLATCPAIEGVEQLARFMNQVLQALRQQYPKRDVAYALRNVWVYVSYTAGATTDEQLTLLAREFGAYADVVDYRRKRNHLYKMRQRGKTALQRAVSGLRAAD